jgi:hypothetical protein
MIINSYGKSSKDLGRAMNDLEKSISKGKTHYGVLKKTAGYDICLEDLSLFLLKDNKVIAMLGLSPFRHNTAVIHLSVCRPEYVGNGLGSVMHETALAHFGTIQSSYDLSVGALKGWHKLCLKYPSCLLDKKSATYFNIEKWSGDMPLVSFKGRQFPATGLPESVFVVRKK